MDRGCIIELPRVLVVHFISLENSLDLLLDLGFWFLHCLDLTIQIFEDFILFR